MDENSASQGWVKWLLGAAGLGAVAAPLGVPRYGVWIALLIVLLLAVFLGGYILWRVWTQRKEKRQFASALQQESATAPRGISDPNKRAKLDDLRRRFQEGVAVYQSRGKDLYKLPWYVFLGEPGSGKTEAIRRSNIGFPPGLQDEFQGAGGTVNMHWWFTNYGVLLDTAGRLIFEEVRPGESSEWKEFLNLLKKTRAHCPINGLFLVFPVDSLIRDSADKISQKAARIAQQLDVIQRTLDIRFPVYVLVTKCDLMTGFREFFDSIEDPQLQHQMMGWSNPEPLDAPFRMDLVDQYLSQVAERLKRRRLSLLRDSAGSGEISGRPLGDVDALFALPQSMLLIAPRLRRYLETIFVAGEWSSKPVFLRGIYFTSSLREGTDLDEALAQALGIPVASLPGGRVWEKDRAYFLRDLFVEKAFRERGLVTRATHTGRMLRNRQIALFGSGFAALALLMFWSWLGWRDLNQSIRQESSYWQTGTNGWKSGIWNPIVRPGLRDPLVFTYAGNDPVSAGTKANLEEYHHQLKTLAMSPLPIRWVFRPITWIRPAQELDRPKGQRILFERSVLQPLIENTRLKMVELGKRASAPNATPIEEGTAKRHWAALLALIQLEADLTFGTTSIEGTNASQKYLQSFVNYLTETNLPAPKKLVDAFAWTYSPAPGGRGVWPPNRFSGGDTLAVNQAIKQGMDQFMIYATQSQKSQTDRLKLLNTIRDQTLEYQRQEAVLIKTAEDKKAVTPAMMESLTLAKSGLYFSLLDAKYQKVAKEGGFSLGIAYTNLIAESQQTSTNAFGDVYRILSGGVKPVTQGLFQEIRTQLSSFQSRNVEDILQSLKQTANIVDLDRDFLADEEASRAYFARWELYNQAYAFRQSKIQVEDLVGQQWRALDDLQKNLISIIAKVDTYKGRYKAELKSTCQYMLEEGRMASTQKTIDEYASYVSSRLNALAANGTNEVNLESLQTAKAFLEKLELDLSSPAMARVPSSEQSKLLPLHAKAEALKNSMVQKYAQVRDAVWGRQIGFPLAFDNQDKILSLEELQKLLSEMSSLEKELASPIWTYFPTVPLQSLRKKTSLYIPIMTALASENRAIRTCGIGIDPKQSDKASRFRWASMSLGGKQPVMKDISGAAQEFGSLPLDQELKIEVRKFINAAKPDDPATKPVNKGDEFWLWGPLELIRKYQDKTSRSADGRIWHISLPVGDDQQQGVISVVLTFDPPLPALADWPKKQTWNQ